MVVDRIERQRRLLKDHRTVMAAKRRQLLVVQRQHVAAEHVGTRPEICVRFFGNSRIKARNVTLLPDPESPSMPSTSPSPSVSERSLTACTLRSPVKRMVEILDFDEVGHAALGARWW